MVPECLRQTRVDWDFGLAVDVHPPPVVRDRTPWPVVLAQAAWELWRRKRAYERRSPASDRG